jgi:putative membrane protein
MQSEAYSRFIDEQLILRDQLAIDRTVLANERTLLSYARTGLAMILAGITFMHFPERETLPLIGVVLTVAGAGVTFFGYTRYDAMRKAIGRIGRQLDGGTAQK